MTTTLSQRKLGAARWKRRITLLTNATNHRLLAAINKSPPANLTKFLLSESLIIFVCIGNHNVRMVWRNRQDRSVYKLFCSYTHRYDLLWTPAQRSLSEVHEMFCECYLFIYLFIYLWPSYAPAQVNGGSRNLYTWWTLSVNREVTTWIFSWSSLNYRVGHKVTKFGIFSNPARKLSALTPERGRIL